MSKNLKRLFIGLSCAVALYSWLGFLLIPSLALSVINQKLSEYSNQPAQLHRLEFNPFNLHLQLWQLHIGQEQTTVAFEQLNTQLAWDSLWRGRVHVKFVNLVSPQAWLDINKQNEVNLAQLLVLPTADETAKPEASTTEPIIVQVDHISIEQGQLRFSDQRPRQPVAVEFNELNLQLENLNTAPDEQGQLQLKLQANDGTQLAWQGDVSLQPLRSSGHLEIENIALSSWWSYAAEQTQLHLDGGLLSFSSDYVVEAQPEWQLLTTNSAITIQQLGLSSQKKTLVKLERFSVSDTALDLQKQSVHIGKIRSQNLSSWVKINEQGQLNWLQAIAPDSPPAATQQAPQSNEAAPTQLNNALAQLPWQIKLDNAQLKNYAVDFTDSSQADPVAIELKQLNITLNDFDSRTDKPVNLTVNSQIGEDGQLALQAQVKPQSFKSTLQLSTSNLDLRPAQAWITPYAKVELLSALLNSQLEAELQQLSPLLATAKGELAINQLHIRDTGQRRDLLKWHSLNLHDIAVTQGEHTQLNIGLITAKQPYARVVIDEQLQTNISKVLVEQPSPNVSPAPTPQAANNFAFHLGEIIIQDGSAHFADFSLKPHFATAIQDLNGRIGSLDNQQDKTTPVKITGSVDRYAPVSIKGSLMPFDPLRTLDLDVNFKQVELTTLTPYSGKFAGYRIQKGRLNLALHYQIDQGKLNASNSVLLEQLQLGDTVDSPDAVKLPLRLAIALLKDTKGNIEIKLPVKGDLNDPEFSVAPIVWQTLRNLITRAASAPFKLLGNLTNNNRDLSQVSYLAGQDSLSEANQQSLKSLALALKQRPQLKLNIEGTSSAVFDGPLVAQNHLHRRIQELWYSDLQKRGKKITASVQDLEVPEKQQKNLLEQLYNELPEQAKLAEELPRNTEERLALMQEQWIKHYSNSTILLRTLAQNRARNIRQYLVEQGQVEPQRLFLMDVNEQAVNDDQGINSLLHLDAL
ncbi:MAG: DUF748 domain-containing protein [Thiopseudomonas sp.]|nr:DUF748 domain-containing protein [Thiopseudomonas sp.]MCK9465482.1 DUF748 domain-containing protein [Thiopseudomonas sp.]